MHRHTLFIAALALASACGGEPAVTDSAARTLLSVSAAEQGGLAVARAATAPFHRFEVAQATGYTFLFMDMCMADASGANRGAMGYHYVNTALLDDKLDVNTPEAVLYEPGPNGQLRLVAVEYVIPGAAWTSPQPPELLGRQLTLNAFGLWALHAWIWKDNPSGMFADWNPNVSCANAAAVTSSGGH
jgi:hypothetical protein